MKKRYFVIPAAMTLLLGLCLVSKSGLPEGFDREEVLTVSEDFIKKLNQQDFDGCYEILSPVMQESMSSKTLGTRFSLIAEGLGGFVRFISATFSSASIQGTAYGVCTIKCQYENETATFTISLNEDLKIGGLAIK